MAIVAGFDVHRAQITFDALDTETGEVTRGRIDSAPPGGRRPLGGALCRARGRRRGRGVHRLAVRLRRARRRWRDAAPGRAGRDPRAARAQATRQDRPRGRPLAARTARRGPAARGLDPARARAPMALPRAAAAHADRRAHPVDTAHPGDAVSPRHPRDPEKLRTAEGRAFLERLELPADARERIQIALGMIDALDAQLAPLEREVRQLARRQTGCRALMRLYGMGELTSLVTLCELGDVGRLSASRKAVRLAGIDIGVRRLASRARARQAHPPGLPAAALGALPGRSVRLPADQSRPRRLPRPQGPRPQPHPRLADHRAQARPPLLPRPAPARADGPRPDPHHLSRARPTPRS